jgi:hypothetical protein
VDILILERLVIGDLEVSRLALDYEAVDVAYVVDSWSREHLEPLFVGDSEVSKLGPRAYLCSRESEPIEVPEALEALADLCLKNFVKL